MVSMSMSSSLSQMGDANFPPMKNAIHIWVHQLLKIKHTSNLLDLWLTSGILDIVLSILNLFVSCNDSLVGKKTFMRL